MKAITDTFVLVAEDCPAATGTVPAGRGAPSVAALEHGLLTAAPYALTLEDLIYEVRRRRAGLASGSLEACAAFRAALFARPHPCMRASPLPKRHGWGVHHDAAGRLALHAVESDAYREFARGAAGLAVVRAMRNRRA